MHIPWLPYGSEVVLENVFRETDGLGAGSSRAEPGKAAKDRG